MYHQVSLETYSFMPRLIQIILLGVYAMSKDA